MKTLLILVVAAVAQASTVQFVSAGSGANDGADYVGPYNLLIDGQPVKGTCISYDLRVGPPNTWTATAEPVSDFAPEYQVKLLEAEWLNHQFATSNDTVGIHHAIWNLFGATYAGTGQWLSEAQQNYRSVDPNSFDLLVPVPANYTQSFLIEHPTPEPATVILLALGIGLFALIFKKRL